MTQRPSWEDEAVTRFWTRPHHSREGWWLGVFGVAWLLVLCGLILGVIPTG